LRDDVGQRGSIRCLLGKLLRNLLSVRGKGESESFIYLAMIRIMLKRVVASSSS
jgi:hypothetical protein